MFEIGHFYQHSTGKKIHVCGIANSRFWGLGGV